MNKHVPIIRSKPGHLTYHTRFVRDNPLDVTETVNTPVQYPVSGYTVAGQWLMDDVSPGRVMKSCEHVKVFTDLFTTQYRPFVVVFSGYDPSGLTYGLYDTRDDVARHWPSDVFGPLTAPFGSDLYPNYKLIPLYTTDIDGHRLAANPIELQSLIDRSLEAMLPGIRPSQSLYNNLVELRDFVSLPRTLKRMSRVVTSFEKMMLTRDLSKKFRKKRKTKTLKELLRSTADGYLQYAFNLNPLVNDLIKTAKSFKSLRSRIQNILDRERLPQHLHFKADLSRDYKDAYHSWNMLPSATYVANEGNYEQQRRVTYKEAVFHATLKYSYTLNSWERANAYTAGGLDSLGLNFNPSIIWNAVPWTFVVDWVANVSSWLDNFKSRLLEPVVDIQDYCWSFAVERSVECTLCVALNSAYTAGSQDVVSRVVERSFKRVAGLPTSRAFSTSGLSPRELSLAVALAIGLERPVANH